MEQPVDHGTSASSTRERIVRVKRKRTQTPSESLWLELTARPGKRREVNLTALSLAESSQIPGVSTRFLFRRVETLRFGEDEHLLPELLKKVKAGKGAREKQETRQARNIKDKKVQLFAAAKEEHEVSSRTARFERVWKSRSQFKIPKEDDPMQEFYHLYDAVCVDVEADSAEKSERQKQARETQLTEGQLLCNYLPLLREFLPTVAAEVENSGNLSTNLEEYVYDIYTVDEEGDASKMRDANYPIFQVMDDENYDQSETNNSDYDSEDSNDEKNSKNDYPEEEDDGCTNEEASDSSSVVDPYSLDNEEYDFVLSSDDESKIWRPRR